jgi:dihydrofolate synthase/folylpolyglutamate synthase
MRYDQAINILFGLESFGVKLGLDNIRLFVERLGRPERNFKSVHVAGTNGKGTVCSTLAAVLTAAGYKTGLFTSPHLIDYRERIRIDGARIPKTEVSRFINRHHEFVRRNRITFFETTAALAFDWFARSECDFAVVEVGLGGRLDATNILQPALAVLTAIDFDHTKTLGRTRRKIAGEKAGIIKPGVPVICAPMADSALEAIKKIAAEKSAPMVDSRSAITLEKSTRGRGYLVRGDGRFPSPLHWRYPGAVHRDNLQTIIAALVQLRRDGYRMGNRQIKHGLSAARWPGRFQIRFGHPLFIYDVAHNAAAARGLAEALPEIVAGRHLSAVCAIAGDKNWRKIIRFLTPQVNRWYFTRFRNRRAWRLTEVRQFAREQKLHFSASRDPQKMVSLARRETPPDGVVLVFGSHFLVGQVLPVSLVDPAPLDAAPDVSAN